MKKRTIPRPLPIGELFAWANDDEQAIAPEHPQMVQPDVTEFGTDLNETLSALAPEGSTLYAVGFDNTDGFLRAGYRVTDEKDADVVVARGGDAEFATAKRAAKKRLILCPTHDYCATATDRYRAADKAFTVIKSGKKPDAVIIERASEISPATIFGEIATLELSAFDYAFGMLMRGEAVNDGLASDISALVAGLTSKLKTHEKDEDYVRLALADAGKTAAQAVESTPELAYASGATQVYEAMRMLCAHEAREIGARGEAEMLLAMYVTDYYIKTLGAKKPLFPPDNNKRIDRVCEYLGADIIRSTVYVSPIYAPEKLKLCEYRCREFQSELLRALAGLRERLTAAFSVFKRLCPDDGYALKSLIEPEDLRICLALAPDVFAADSLLSLFKQQGVLENFLV